MRHMSMKGKLVVKSTKLHEIKVYFLPFHSEIFKNKFAKMCNFFLSRSGSVEKLIPSTEEKVQT